MESSTSMIDIKENQVQASTLLKSAYELLCRDDEQQTRSHSSAVFVLLKSTMNILDEANVANG